MIIQIKKYAVLILMALGLAACSGGGGGGGSSSPTTNNNPPSSGSGTPTTPPIGATLIVGQFIDSPVEGLRYTTGTTCDATSPVTNAKGEFSYHAGEQVRFCIGSVVIGPVLGAQQITPLTVFGTSSLEDQRVINLARFLQTLDSDNILDNGITIDPLAQTAAAGKTVDFNTPVAVFESNADVLSIVNNSNSKDTVLVSETSAVAHLQGLLRYVYFTTSPTLTNVAGTLTTIDPTAPAVTTNTNPALVNPAAGTDIVQRIAKVFSGSFDGVTGNASNFQLHAVVFVSGGSIFKKSAIVASSVPAAVQISSASGIASGPGDGSGSANDLCRLDTYEDAQTPDNSTIVYGLAGPDKWCDSSDDAYAWLRLNTLAATAPTSIPGIVLVDIPLRDSTLAITGYTARNTSGALVKLDVNFANPVVAANGAGPFTRVDFLTDQTARGILLAQVNNTIRTYDPTTNTLGLTVLATLSQADRFEYDYDADDLYFVDNAPAGSNVIQRISLAAPAAATTVVTEPGGNISRGIGDDLVVTPTRIAYTTVPDTGIRSVLRTATNATSSTALVNGAPGSTLGIVAWNGNKLYVDEWASNLTGRAHSVNDDGTGLVTTADARWVGAFVDHSFNVYRGSVDAQQVVLLQRSAASTSDAGATLSTYTAQTGTAAGIVLGTVPPDINLIDIIWDAPGSDGLTIGSGTNKDVFYLDALSPGSFTRITNDPTVEQLLIWD